MELSETEESEALIEKLVSSGKVELDEEKIKRLKSLCKHSEACLEHCFHILMSQLLREHSEVRLSAFQITNELFVRSHMFRTLLLGQFQQFMDCTIETDFDNPLPPPKQAADKLKEDALLAIRNWNDKYGIAYQKLSLAFEFLKHVKKINFDQPRPSGRNRAHEQRLSRKKIVNGMILDKLHKEIEEQMWEIKNAVAEIRNCLNLLVPTFDDESPDTLANVVSDKPASSARETGIPDHGYVVELDLSEVATVKVTENDDNEAIFDRLKDLTVAANRIHIPRLRKWLSTASKCEEKPEMIKNLIDVKIEIQDALNKCSEVKVIADLSDEDCDDFVDVPEMSNSPSTSGKNSKLLVTGKDKDLKNTTNIWKPLKDGDINDPTSYNYALAKQAKLLEAKEIQRSSSSKTQKLQKIIPSKKLNSGNSNKAGLLKHEAPVVPFGRDLFAWDAKKLQELKTSVTLSAGKEYDVGHRFYGGHSASETDKGVSDAVLSSITSRTIEFTGDFEPVSRSCNAPLPNGKLCPRLDRYKCPFHGKIIPRDACGNPLSATDQPSTSSQSNDWNDPQYLEDLERNLGGEVSLTRKKKKEKTSDVGLTDLKKKSTSRSRLQRKVLSRKSLKRVAETMNVLDAKRNLDKFGNNFNYALH